MITIIKGVILRITLYLVTIGVILQATYFALNYLPEKNKILSAVATHILQKSVQVQIVTFEGSILEPIFSLQNVVIASTPAVQLQQLHIMIDVWKSIQHQTWMTKKFVLDHLNVRFDRNSPRALQLTVDLLGNPFSNTSSAVQFRAVNAREKWISGIRAHRFTMNGTIQLVNHTWIIVLHAIRYADTHLSVRAHAVLQIHANKPMHLQIQGDTKLHFSFLKTMQAKIPFYASTNIPFNIKKPLMIAVTFKDFALFHQTWHHLLLNIQSLSEGVRLQLYGPEINGEVFLPFEKKLPVRVSMNYLYFNTSKNTVKEGSPTQTLNPIMIPPLDLSIQHLYVNHDNNGKLNLITRPTQNGLLIRQFNLHSPFLHLTATGQWITRDLHRYTVLRGQVESKNLGQWLARHHLSARLKHGVLLSDFDLSWVGNPSQFSLTNATGFAHVTVRDGRIIQLNSDTESNLTLGRLLNLFSLESISHLLTFNFSSFTKKGFPFDVLQGKFEMANGALFARNLEIKGSLANVNLNGKISVANQTNNLNMTVFPKVSSSIPMIVGVAGGPVIGVVAWAANKMMASSVGKMMAVNYHIGGTLDKPTVVRK